MKKKILIRNLHKKIKISNKLLKKIISDILDYLFKEKPRKTVEVSILLVDTRYIKSLNKRYRKVDEVTDVLAFPQQQFIRNKLQQFTLFPLSTYLLGDVVISLDCAQEQAQIYDNKLIEEVVYLIIHGILHLLGYSDKRKNERKKMVEMQNKIMADIWKRKEK